MKTPREILLGQHKGRLPALDARRCAALEKAFGPRRELPTSAASQPLMTAWRELIHPYRQAWAGLAAVWVLLLAASLWPGGTATQTAAAPKPPPHEFMAFCQQERMLAELLEPRPLPISKPAKASPPQPHSERRDEFIHG